LRDAPGFQIVSELAPRPEDAVFDKITMSAFEGTPLAIALRDCGISSIAIVGIATEVGIEPTARHAADLCFIPVIIADACGGGDEAAARGWTLDELADLANTSRATLVGLFQKSVQASPLAFLADRRLALARQRMRTRYRSESAFSRAYRPSIATGPTSDAFISLWNGRSVELIWVKFTLRATPHARADRFVPIVLRKSVQNLTMARPPRKR
jgi:AraC-like DNA-binding protein